jgi:hypothetical protein
MLRSDIDSTVLAVPFREPGILVAVDRPDWVVCYEDDDAGDALVDAFCLRRNLVSLAKQLRHVFIPLSHRSLTMPWKAFPTPMKNKFSESDGSM